MHLKILIGVLTLGLATASPKAKAAPKALFQHYSGGQPDYYPFGTNNIGQNYGDQPFPGQQSQQSLGPYNAGFVSSNYGQSSGNPSGVPLYPQNLAGNYYQQSQSIPVPVAYPNAPSGNIDPLANDYGTGRLWPKHLVNPAQSPARTLASSASIYYPSSTPSPTAYQSAGNYVNPSFDRNFQSPVSTPSPVQAQYPRPIPVPLKVGSRNSFQPEITNYNTAPYNAPFAGSAAAAYLPSYQQQSTPAPVQSYQQPTNTPYSAYQQQSLSGASYVAQYQQPYQDNYQQQRSPAPYQFNYHQQPTPAPYQANYHQQSTPGSYVDSYQQSTARPFEAYQQGPTVSPYPPYQQPAGDSYLAKYQQSTTSPFLENYQRFPVPVGYPQNQIQPQPTKSTLISLSAAPSYPSVPDKSSSGTIESVPNSTPATETVSITEKPFIPVSSTASTTSKPSAAVIKSELINGNVSPQYNHIPQYSTARPFASNLYLPQEQGKSSYGLSYAPANSVHGYSGYSPSTAASQVSYNGLGGSYNY